MTKVIINGAKGKMGQAACEAIKNDPTLHLVAAIDKSDNLETEIKKNKPDVVVDLTHPDSVFNNVSTILKLNCHAVVGTTGLTKDQLEQCNRLAASNNKSAIICPNFAISAILMMKFAQQAAEFMNRCEIIEYHHDKKADAPSGTAIKSAELIAEANSEINSETYQEQHIIEGSRGGKKHNIPIHAIRLPGVVANQEIIFGAQGQTLTLRHDTISREAFMPGLILAIKATKTISGLVYGLESIMFNEES